METDVRQLKRENVTGIFDGKVRPLRTRLPWEKWQLLLLLGGLSFYNQDDPSLGTQAAAADPFKVPRGKVSIVRSY